ncbi:Threonylcarbamoyladenosine tRNA methylthiotransferase MtaB [Candidatus Karelsulcia muelleri]|uniref:MiaB/RimO family radical SAM methylthiotransferase n=1 Tax=Candidatus Karelsulcia muelleri TaxID=336810 RepID=UPI001FF291C0|nr:MiaB/RimO family radical SAM methylthiotransferase [Candidatus Karelsulcia muelleri]UOQ27689.1 Threonylcarbamoyladenosine tRNA methylthiotransferase MtaB [Candidatus Karelsulcia muelleri]
MEKLRFSFITYGCKLNYSEYSTIKRNLLNLGYQYVSWDTFANIYIINTCTITENAEKDFFLLIRKIKKTNKNAYIILLGCFPQKLYKTETENIYKTENNTENTENILKNVNLILGTKDKFSLPYYLKLKNKTALALNAKAKTNSTNSNSTYYNSNSTYYNYNSTYYNYNYNSTYYNYNYNSTYYYNSSVSLNETRTRSFLKIQDGCDYKCSYCPIPNLRGKSRSENIYNIIKTIKKLALLNIKEIVLTGINIGNFVNFGFNKKKYDLFYLLNKIEQKINYKIRIRISSIEPNLLNNRIINLISKSKIFVPHFHLPLQSGSNYILNKMKRRYNVKIYIKKVNKILNIIPEACVGTDIIVGFPGEKESNFLETYNLLKSLELAYIQVFPYSERENTDAYFMKETIPKILRYKRSKIIRLLSKQKNKNYCLKNLFNHYRVLFEKTNKNGYIFGFTDTYIRSKIKWKPNLINKFKEVKLIKIDNYNNMECQIL